MTATFSIKKQIQKKKNSVKKTWNRLFGNKENLFFSEI